MKDPFKTSSFVRCLITPGELLPENFEELAPKLLHRIDSAVRDGIEIVQIREKNLPAKLIFQLASHAVMIASVGETAILVNERADIAAASGADGVHLPANSFSPHDIRKNFPSLLIGMSTHSNAELLQAANEGADFAFFGPVFWSPAKAKFGETQGIERLEKACALANDVPVLAVGGIDRANFREVRDAGARGIAAIRMFLEE